MRIMNNILSIFKKPLHKVVSEKVRKERLQLHNVLSDDVVQSLFGITESSSCIWGMYEDRIKHPIKHSTMPDELPRELAYMLYNITALAGAYGYSLDFLMDITLKNIKTRERQQHTTKTRK